MINRGNWARNARRAILGIPLAVAASACNDDTFVPLPRFDLGPCPSSVASLPALANARCGELTVLENRQKANGKTIRLPVAIVPSVAKPPTRESIFHLAGGPGADALAEAEFLVPAGLNKDRDLIIMGQRGTLDTKPELLCPEIDQFNAHSVGLVYNAPSTGALHVAATKACRDRLVAAGIDLGAYNTSENAADVVDLRNALGISKWSLYAYSYGTYLALTLMRDHAAGIVSVILDSVAPPSVASLGWTWSSAGEAFGNLFDACAAQPACAGKYGDVRATFTGLVQQLEANPLTGTGTYAPNVPPFKVVLDGGALVNWLVAAGPNFASVPAAIHELAQGQPARILNARSGLAQPCEGAPDKACNSTFGYGLTYGVFCSEWIPYEPQSEILAQGRRAFPLFPDSVLSQAPQLPFETEDCGIWNVPKAPASIREVTTSNIPTLVIAGSFDAKTSPKWAQYAAATLPNSTTIVIPGRGHWVLPLSDCARTVVGSFLSDPTRAPDTGCVAGVPIAPFE